KRKKRKQQPGSRSCPPSVSTSLQSVDQSRMPPANGSNGSGHDLPVMPTLTADPTVIAAAELVLKNWIAEPQRLRAAKDLMPTAQERLGRLDADVPLLDETIRIAKRLLN